MIGAPGAPMGFHLLKGALRGSTRGAGGIGPIRRRVGSRPRREFFRCRCGATRRRWRPGNLSLRDSGSDVDPAGVANVRGPGECLGSRAREGRVSMVEIRRQEPADADELHDVYSQPKVIWGTLQMPHPSLHAWRTSSAEEPKGMVRLVARMDDRVVGNIAIWTATSPRRRHVGEVAMAVHDNWHGKGCGSALLNAALDIADNWMDLRRIELQVFTDNEPGLRLYQRCGFEIEGTLRQYAFREGNYVDVYAMARLR